MSDITSLRSSSTSGLLFDISCVLRDILTCLQEICHTQLTAPPRVQKKRGAAYRAARCLWAAAAVSVITGSNVAAPPGELIFTNALC